RRGSLPAARHAPVSETAVSHCLVAGHGRNRQADAATTREIQAPSAKSVRSRCLATARQRDLTGRDTIFRLRDGYELLRVLRQHLAAVLGDGHEILDPHAEAAREIDPRLDGDDVAGDERVARLRPER